ncbi:hypothetical protein FQA39_LY10745 [Lamprigera yunnana]|nr:hypothetical protein FQA39_LY10745 [Lamprigera yunnana]
MPLIQNRRRSLTEEELLDIVNNLFEIDDISDDPGDNYEEVSQDAGNVLQSSFLSKRIPNNTDDEENSPEIDVESQIEVMDLVDQK